MNNTETINKKLEELKLIASIRQKEGLALEKLVEGMELLKKLDPDRMPAALMNTYFHHRAKYDSMWVDLDLQEQQCWAEIIAAYKSK